MGGAPRNPAPRNHFLVWIVKPSGCHCTDGHLTSRVFTEDQQISCQSPLGALPLYLPPNGGFTLFLTSPSTETLNSACFGVTCCPPLPVPKVAPKIVCLESLDREPLVEFQQEDEIEKLELRKIELDEGLYKDPKGTDTRVTSAQGHFCA